MSEPRTRRGTALTAAAGLVWTAGPHLALTLGGVALMTGLAPVATAWLVKALVDTVAESNGGAAIADLAPPAAGLALVGIVTLALPPVSAYCSAELERRVAVVVHTRLFSMINQLPGLRSFEDPTFHNQLRLAQQGGETAPPIVLSVGVTIVQEIVTLAGFTALLFVVSPIVAVLVLAAALPALVVERRLSRQQANLAFALSPHERRRIFYGNLQTDERAAKEIRLFGLGGHFLTRMLREFSLLNASARHLDRNILRHKLALGLLAAVLGGIALLVVANKAAAGSVSIGEIVVVVAALAGLQASTTATVTSVGHVHEALLLLDHYRTFVNRTHDIETDVHRPCPPLIDAIELRDVWFRYAPDHPWILRGVSLRIPLGSAVGLVGVNGSGKSTIVKLLCRFYDPERGAVLWDGVDIREFEIASVRQRIATVFQDFMEYDLTAADNILVGDLRRRNDLAAIRDAAHDAGVDSTLARLPRGYETVLSRMFAEPAASQDLVVADDAMSPIADTGVDLSGGQWQRVAIARMLFRSEPDVLILDEPSAGLDAAAEHEIHERLLVRRQVTTSLLISHRLNAIALADEIAVLAGGVVTEFGSHAELLARDGEYARLFRLQASGYLETTAYPA